MSHFDGRTAEKFDSKNAKCEGGLETAAASPAKRRCCSQQSPGHTSTSGTVRRVYREWVVWTIAAL